MKHDHEQSTKLRVGILFGGKSAEHEISVLSAKNVIAALDVDRFEAVLIGIDAQGGWHRLSDPDMLDGAPVRPNHLDLDLLTGIDVAFPILHGPLGEDGTLQGLLELAGIPYVGCGVMSSAANMDKDIAKRLLRAAGIAVADWITVAAVDRPTIDVAATVQALGLPLFVKPADMGSSIGVSKVERQEDLLHAIDDAFQYDRKILIEKAIVGDEVECAVLGNESPKAARLGRIIPKANFYTYEAKYQDEDNTVLEIPANIPDDVARSVQALALQAYKVMGCEGMSRVDTFVTPEGEVIINEINTIPGFTRFSMYPQMWEASGISYTDLITQLLLLAIDRAEQRRKLRTTHT
ncbi:MAG: D-alanine--D-alanine ligase family protein [Candidatus Saccharibacteria bacterium]